MSCTNDNGSDTSSHAVFASSTVFGGGGVGVSWTIQVHVREVEAAIRTSDHWKICMLESLGRERQRLMFSMYLCVSLCRGRASW